MSDMRASCSDVGIQPSDHQSVTTDKPASNKRLIKTVYLLPSVQKNINIPRSTPIKTTVIIGGKMVVCVSFLLFEV